MAVQRVAGVGEVPPVELPQERPRAGRVGREPAVQPREQERAQLRLRVAGPEAADLVLAKDVVAAEELVGALAGEHDLEPRVLNRARQLEQRRRGRPQERLLCELDHAREDGRDIGRAHGRPVKLHAELRRDRVLRGGLVEALVAEADAERVQARADGARRERGGDRRVEASAQVRGDGNVRAQPDLRRRLEDRLELVHEVVLRRVDGVELEIPPAPLLDDSVAADDRVVRRRKLPDSHEGGAVRQRRPGGERVHDPDWVELAPRRGVAQERLRLRREADVAPELGEEQRPHAEAVARQQHLLPLAVPDGDGEVSVQAIEEARAPLLVGVRDHLGVARRREPVPELPQLVHQLDVVVDLAVLHHPVAPALLAEGLVAAGEVDDRQPRVRHPEGPVEVEPGAVGTAMAHLTCHREQERGVNLVLGAPVDAGKAAHLFPRIGAETARFPV